MFIPFAVLCAIAEPDQCQKIYNRVAFEDEKTCIQFVQGPGAMTLLMYLQQKGLSDKVTIEDMGCEHSSEESA